MMNIHTYIKADTHTQTYAYNVCAHKHSLKRIFICLTNDNDDDNVATYRSFKTFSIVGKFKSAIIPIWEERCGGHSLAE